MFLITKTSFVIALFQILQISRCSPLGEIVFKKNFDFAIKPWVHPPKEFVFEKWSPFKFFGIKHIIKKRAVDTPEIMSLVKIPLEKDDLSRLPVESDNDLERAGLEVGSLAPGIPKLLITPNKLFEGVLRGPPSNELYTDVTKIFPIENKGIEEQPLGPEVVHMVPLLAPPLPVKDVPPLKENGIEEKGEPVPLPPPPPPPPLPQPPVVRGSRLAFQFGNVLLQFLASFLESARMTLNQFAITPPPPPA